MQDGKLGISQDSGDVGKKSRGKTYQSNYPLPPESLSVEKILKVLCDITKAARKGDEYVDVTVGDVTAAIGTLKEDISRCLKFFASAGLIAHAGIGKPFKPTREAVEYTSDATWQPEQAKKALAKAFEGKWFVQIARSNIDGAKTCSREELITRLGRAAEAGDEPQAKQKLSRLVDLIIHSGMIGEDPGTKQLTMSVAGQDQAQHKEDAPHTGDKARAKDEPKDDKKGDTAETDGQPDKLTSKWPLVIDQVWPSTGKRISLRIFSEQPLRSDDLEKLAPVFREIEKLGE